MFEAVQALAERITEAQKAKLKERAQRVYAPRSTNVSAIGYRCERRTVYARTRPEMADPIGEDLASIFQEGDLHHSDVRRKLSELGFEVLEAERSFRDSSIDVSGKIDGKLSVDESDHRAERVPTEIKSISGNPPEDQYAMKHGPELYRRYYDSFQLYLFLTDSPYGLFIFKNKITGKLTPVPVELDYAHAEELLKKAERIKAHVEAGTLPERLADRSECKACPFRDSVCLPAEEPIDPLFLVEDAKLLEELEEHERLDPKRRRWKQLDDSIKERFLNTKGDRFVAGGNGEFLITKKKHGNGQRIVVERLTNPTN